MNRQEALEAVLSSYRKYYDINRENPLPPFAAEAVFSVHDENYFLIRSAKISESESSEYAFFAEADCMDEPQVRELDRIAWEEGLRRTKPGPNHRNTDITLVILADQITEEAAGLIRKNRHYKSYYMGLRGWNNYKLIAYELSTGKIFANRQAEPLKKVMANIKKQNEKENSK